MSTKPSKKQPVAGTPTETIPSTSATTLNNIEILQTAKALKLTPGSTSTVGYELGRHPESQALLIRLTGSDSGGLCSKEWFELSTVMTLLDQQSPDKPFSSALFKTIWNNKGSSNNAAFLAAALRHQGLIKAAPEVRFAHLITGTHATWFEQLKTTEPTPQSPQ